MSEPMTDDAREARLWRLVPLMDQRIDDGAGPAYHEQPLAQDWARVAKVKEERGEVIDALIGYTAQNHRKGQYGTLDDLLTELADVALTGVYAIQHFTKDVARTRDIFLGRAERHAERVGIADPAVPVSESVQRSGGNVADPQHLPDDDVASQQ